jgi:TrmH family RNA methyltransferase
LIRSRSNPLIKQARSLRQRKARADTGLFVVEGIHHVGEVVAAGWEVEAILYAPDRLKSDFGRDLISRFSGRIEAASAEVFDSAAGKDNPQGILAIVRQKLFRMVDLPALRCGVALAEPQDPGNLGTVLRSLDAVGADALFVLNGGVDQYHPTAIRAGMGASFWIPVLETTFAEFDVWRRQRGVQLIGTSAHAGTDHPASALTKPWILLFGSEQKGLSGDQLLACDFTVSLPMRGRTSSLNLAVAAGILLYRFA